MRTTRQAWIDEGLRVLADGSPDGVRVEVLAKNLDVTKGGFYGHFSDRQEFLQAMLEEWERQSVDEVLDRVHGDDGDARSKLQLARRLTFSTDHLLAVDLAVRDWARRDASVAARLKKVDNRRMELLRELIGTFCSDPAEVEARSLLTFYATVGQNFVDVDLRDSTGSVMDHAAKLLFADE